MILLLSVTTIFIGTIALKFTPGAKDVTDGQVMTGADSHMVQAGPEWAQNKYYLWLVKKVVLGSTGHQLVQK